MCIGELQRVSRELTPNPNVRFATKPNFAFRHQCIPNSHKIYVWLARFGI